MNKIVAHRLVVASILLLASLCVYSARRSSSRTELNHYIRVSADFAYARGVAHDGYVTDGSQVLTLQEAKQIVGSDLLERGIAGNGYAPGLGVGYRLAYGAFRFDIGLGAEYRKCSMQPHNLTNIQAIGYDAEGLSYTGYHSWTERRTVLQHVGLNLPVMFGGEWNKVCVMAGVKANIDVWGRSAEKGYYTLVADYERYMDPFSDMPNHGYVTNEPYSCEQHAQTTSWSMRVCAEVGYCVYGGEENRYRRNESIRLYVSAFGEYGVIGSQQSYTPLLVGARVTMLLPLPKQRECTCWKF